MRTCWECTSIVFINGQPDYSDLTPGTNAELFCDEGHWKIDFYHETLHSFRDQICMAKDCKDFTPREK